MDDAGDFEAVTFDSALECFVVSRQAKPLCGFNHVMENGPDGFCRHRCGDLKGVMGKYLHGHLTSAFTLAPFASRSGDRLCATTIMKRGQDLRGHLLK